MPEDLTYGEILRRKRIGFMTDRSKPRATVTRDGLQIREAVTRPTESGAIATTTRYREQQDVNVLAPSVVGEAS